MIVIELSLRLRQKGQILVAQSTSEKTASISKAGKQGAREEGDHPEIENKFDASDAVL